MVTQRQCLCFIVRFFYKDPGTSSGSILYLEEPHESQGAMFPKYSYKCVVKISNLPPAKEWERRERYPEECEEDLHETQLRSTREETKQRVV